MTQTVLVTYGDGSGPKVIRSAERVLRLVAPDLDIIHGRIGADAYENTSYALPPETMEMISRADMILSGPVCMEGINERDPLVTIKKQMGLFLDYREYYPLKDVDGSTRLDTVVISPTLESTMDVYETESLDGVASEFYTDIESVERLMSRSSDIARMKHRPRIDLVTSNYIYPKRERLIQNMFLEHFRGTAFRTGIMSLSETVFTLAHRPEVPDVLLCDIHSAASVKGAAAGIVGGTGLMPQAFFGNGKSLFTPATMFGEDIPHRSENPTSAILSVALLLLSIGMEDGYRAVRNAVRMMYRDERTTPDIGGKLTPDKFTDGIIDLVKADIYM
ncbi:MAG: isocitrate/isopropylmalate family dehydrogenase [archaeon]|nr:isocitrate/isopropylmalate family dehydrogenase [archaeon]